jgi:hypothetical protein
MKLSPSMAEVKNALSFTSTRPLALGCSDCLTDFLVKQEVRRTTRTINTNLGCFHPLLLRKLNIHQMEAVCTGIFARERPILLLFQLFFTYFSEKVLDHGRVVETCVMVM